jgi:signal transduction histidine kinase
MLEELRQKTRETPVNVQTIDLGAFISKTIKEIPIPESVKVNIRHAASVKTVEIDPVKIRRVLENLIRNAVEAMNAVGRLSILTLDLGDTFQIKVSDTGVGIPSDKIQFLFKPFYTTKEKGLGLGLSYSQKAIEAHSGKIDVESKLGEGTTFILTIPKRHYVEDEGKPTLNK